MVGFSLFMEVRIDLIRKPIVYYVFLQRVREKGLRH